MIVVQGGGAADILDSWVENRRCLVLRSQLGGRGVHVDTRMSIITEDGADHNTPLLQRSLEDPPPPLDLDLDVFCFCFFKSMTRMQTVQAYRGG